MFRTVHFTFEAQVTQNARAHFFLLYFVKISGSSPFFFFLFSLSFTFCVIRKHYVGYEAEDLQDKISLSDFSFSLNTSCCFEVFLKYVTVTEFTFFSSLWFLWIIPLCVLLFLFLSLVSQSKHIFFFILGRPLKILINKKSCLFFCAH